MSKNTELSEAMSARLCHDLSGSIGAIDNYLTLLDHENKDISIKARNLISEETANLVQQVRFFRSVYANSGNESTITLAKLTQVIIDFFKDTKVTLNLHCEEDFLDMNSSITKSAIVLAVLCADNINNSGTIDFYINKNNDSPIWMFGTGDKLLLKEENLEVLQGNNNTEINVRNCREHYVNLLCSSENYQILVTKKTNSIKYKLLKKS